MLLNSEALTTAPELAPDADAVVSPAPPPPPCLGEECVECFGEEVLPLLVAWELDGLDDEPEPWCLVGVEPEPCLGVVEWEEECLGEEELPCLPVTNYSSLTNT